MIRKMRRIVIPDYLVPLSQGGWGDSVNLIQKIKKEEEEEAARRNWQLQVSSDASKFLKDQKFSDVKIILKNSTFYAHKAILSARCPVFATMFAKNPSNEVNITGIKDEIFQELLRFIYSGSVQNIDSFAIELLEAADEYELKDLKSVCGSNLDQNLTINNVTELLILADQYKLENLKFSAIEFINKNAAIFIKTKGYNSLVKSELHLIAELFQQQYSSTSSEITSRSADWYIKEAKHNVSMDLKKLVDDETFSDVKIVFKNSILHAHKAILSSRSPVFAAMFEHEMFENSNNEVHITDIEDKTFQDLLRFIYSGTVNDFDYVSGELLMAADKYAIDDLKNLCGSSLSKRLTIDNVIEMLVLADQFNTGNLKLAAFNFVNENGTKVIQTEGYTFLVKNHLNLIEELYRHQHTPKE